MAVAVMLSIVEIYLIDSNFLPIYLYRKTDSIGKSSFAKKEQNESVLGMAFKKFDEALKCKNQLIFKCQFEKEHCWKNNPHRGKNIS